MYIKRHIEPTIKKALNQSKVVLVTGARQVGKTTCVRELLGDYTYITLDDENELNLALNDRGLFFRDRKFPLIIDEVQYAGELLRAVKLEVDKTPKKGQIVLTGSQTYDLLGLSAESLAGRVSIIEMSSMSMREKLGIDCNLPFCPNSEYESAREKNITRYDKLWSNIHRGSMPELMDPDRDWEWYWRDYVRTYIERDIRRIVNVKDEMKFRAFLTALAAHSGGMLIYDGLAKDIGVDTKTVMHWTSVVAASGLVHILHTFSNNAIKRAIKTPKIYFMDTGLLCYLAGWKTVESAQNGAMSGSIFETFVVSEILKSYMNAGRDTDHIYYYRDKDKREIDIVIDADSVIYPVEIKKSATVSNEWSADMNALNSVQDRTVARGVVICLADHKINVSESVKALPIEYI